MRGGKLQGGLGQGSGVRGNPDLIFFPIFFFPHPAGRWPRRRPHPTPLPPKGSRNRSGPGPVEAGEPFHKMRQRQRGRAGQPAPSRTLPAPGLDAQAGGRSPTDDPVAVAEGTAPRRQQAPGSGEGLPIPLLPQKGREQGPGRRADARRHLGPAQPARHRRGIRGRGKLQVQRPPAGNAEKTHEGRGRHGGRRDLPIQCHHRDGGPSPLAGSAWPPKAPDAMTSPGNRRPAWLNWLILAAFLWSSWQLAGLWATRLHG